MAIIAVMVWITACSGPEKSVPPPSDEDSAEVVMEQPDTVLFWVVDDYKKIKTQVYKDTSEITEPQSVVNGINSIFPDIPLQFQKLSNDTVYASIDSSFKFSDDMGSSGALQYLSTVIVNLTTLKNVNYVNLQFPEGSHAAPGVYSRKAFDKYSIQAAPPENQ